MMPAAHPTPRMRQVGDAAAFAVVLSLVGLPVLLAFAAAVGFLCWCLRLTLTAAACVLAASAYALDRARGR